MKNKVELLAPAGNIESFKAACQNGADAIYMGIDRFNARVMAQNFSLEEYIECIQYAHLRNVKVYLTLNTLLYNDEIKEAIKIVLKLYSCGLDAVIVQDIGLAMLLYEYIPSLDIHASTQMSVYSLPQVEFLKKIGFTRVVLARELTIEEIEYICKNTDVEIEVFVHGALCVSFSGQCLLSSNIGNRSANRGNCAQPCRMKYSLYNSKEKQVVSSTYIMSKKDIFGLEYIEKLVSIGVTSLKLEGRNKAASYVAGVTSVYRKYIDKIVRLSEDNIAIEENDKKDLMQLFNRNGLSFGYLNGVKYKNSITLKSPKNTGLYLGKVEDQKGIYVKVKLEQDLNMHDGFEIFNENDVVSNIVTCIKDKNGKIINREVKAGEIVFFGDVGKKIKFGSEVYKTSSESLNKRYKASYENNVQNIKNIVDVKLNIKNGEKILAYVYVDSKEIKVEFDCIPDIAQKKEVTKEAIFDVFDKTKDTPFKFNVLELNLDNGLFIPVSKLNEFRRYVIDKITSLYVVNIDITEKESNLDNFLDSWKENYKNCKKNLTLNNSKDKKNVADDIANTTNMLFVYSYDKTKDYISIYKDMYNKELECLYVEVFDYIKNREDIIQKYISKVDVIVSIPNVVLDQGHKVVTKNLESILKDKVSGFLLGSLAYLENILSLREKYNFKIIADYTLNTTNIYSAMYYSSLGFDKITLGFDVLESDIETISKYVNIELVKDYVTVMTSRYCILGSMVEDRKENVACKMPCKNDRYYLKDSYGYKYDIICNNIDCIMKIVSKIKKFGYFFKDNDDKNIYSVRNCIL